MSTTTTKSVALRIVADAGTAKETLDRIAQQTDDLEHKKASVTVNVHAGDTKAQLDEITAKADALGIKNVTFKVKADTSQATRKMAETKAESDSLKSSFFGAALSVTGFGDVMGAASGDASIFSRVMAGVSAATGILEPALAGVVVATGGIVSGLAAAGAGLGVFGLVAKSTYSEVTPNIQAYTKAQQAAQTATTAAAKSKALDQMKTAFNGLSDSQKQFALSVVGAQNAWQGFVSSATPGVTSVMDSGLKLLPQLFKDLQPLLPPVESALKDIIGQLGKKLDSAGFKSFIGMLADNTGPAIEKIATAIGHVIVGVGGIVKAFMPMSQGMLSGLDRITASFARWGETLNSHTGFQSLMATFKSETPLAMQALKNLASALLGVGKAMTGLATPANSKTLLQLLVPLTAVLAKIANGNPVLVRTGLYLLAAAQAGNKLKNVFTGLVGEGSALRSVATGIGNFASGFSNAESAASEATRVMGTFGGKVSGMVDAIKSWTIWSTIASGATKVWTGIQAAFDVVMDANPIVLVVIGIAALIAAIVVMSTKVKAFRNFWKDAWKDVTKFFSDAFSFIKSHWELILAILTGPVGAAVIVIVKYWHDIEGAFVDAWREIAGFFSGIWRSITGGVSSMVSGVVGLFRGFGNDVVGVFSDAGTWLYNVGRNILVGLWNGIVSMADWVIKQVENFANSITKAFGWVLKIFSPSKVFWEHGKNIALGVGHGILENANFAVGAVTQLGKSVSNAMSASVGGSYGGGSSGSQAPVTNNFNITGLVTNPDGVARQIAQILNDYNRHNGRQAVFA